jgi:prephenate dehydrogenase
MSRTSDKAHATEPYGTIAIAGLGLIGGSLALALRRAGYTGRILGVSRKETIEEALRLGAIDQGFGYDDLPAATAQADLVILSSPILTILEHLRRLGGEGALRAGAIITDVGSTKRAILRAAAEHLPAGVCFIGGHPLAGSEHRGLGAADPFLFQNAYYVLTPAPGVPGAAVEKLGGFVARTGARLMVLSAETHDRVAATISHLPQLLAVSLVRFLDDLGPHREEGVRLAAGGFRDMTRIASSPFSVWKDIVATNHDTIAQVLERFLASARDGLRGLDPAQLEKSFQLAAETRGAIPRDTKGFLRRLWDVLVVVEDKPGVIASIAGPLATKGLNIKDIEVLKVREGEGGTMRLAFESQEVARAAIAELQAAGFSARLRD